MSAGLTFVSIPIRLVNPRTPNRSLTTLADRLNPMAPRWRNHFLASSRLVKIGKNCSIDPTATIHGPTVIGTKALLGRGFIAEDDLDGARPVVVLGYSIWQSRYAGDPNVLGKTIKVNDLLATVVGVMPPGMQFPPNTDLWLPFGQATINRGQSRQVRNYEVIARLADGVMRLL